MIITKNIEIDWIRHAFSCSNMLHELTAGRNKKYSALAPDAILSNYGISQATRAKNDINFLNRYDIIICSNLTRALETALFLFNDDKIRRRIVVVPYISEKRKFWDRFIGSDEQNIPTTSDNIKKTFDKLNNANNFNIDVDISLLKYFEDLGTDLSPNYNKFIEDVVPYVLAKIKKECKDKKDNYKIAAVSHNNFIRDHLSQLGKSVLMINNVQIWREQLAITLEYKVVRYENMEPDCGNRYIDGTVCKLWDGFQVPNNIVNGSSGRCGKIYGEKYENFFKRAQSNKKN